MSAVTPKIVFIFRRQEIEAQNYNGFLGWLRTQVEESTPYVIY